MTDKVIQIVTESARVTVLTQEGRLYHGNRGEKDGATGYRQINWEPIALPPGCDSGVVETDHSGILTLIAEIVRDAGPHSALNMRESAAIWGLVEDWG